MPSPTENLARNVLALRQSRAWTQEELAGRVGISARYIGKIERRQASATVEIVGRLARAFGVEASDLLNAKTGRSQTSRAMRRI